MCRVAGLDEMHSHPANLGEVRSVHRPSKPRIWPTLALGTPLLMIAALCSLLLLDSFTGVITGSKEGTSDDVSNYLICMGVVGLLLALMGAILVGDYRAWSATKTVRLTIYREGFTYESRGRMEVCRWGEVERIKSGSVAVHSKAFRARAKVIRSVVKKDGTEIKLAETLDLRQITSLMTAAKDEARRPW